MHGSKVNAGREVSFLDYGRLGPPALLNLFTLKSRMSPSEQSSHVLAHAHVKAQCSLLLTRRGRLDALCDISKNWLLAIQYLNLLDRLPKVNSHYYLRTVGLCKEQKAN